MRHKSKESRLYSEIKTFDYKEKFKVFLDYIELVKIQQNDLADIQKRHSFEQARIRGNANQASTMEDIGKGLFEGRPWALKMYYDLLKSLEGR